MDLGIAGRTALVTAAGSGLGRAIAAALAAEGVRVAVTGRSMDRLDETVRQIGAAGGQAQPFVLDLAAATHAASLDAVRSAFDAPDILVNVCGGPPLSSAAAFDRDLWVRATDSMLFGTISLTAAVVPEMRRRGWGRIVTCASSGVVVPIAGLTLSNALRSALMAWSKTLASEVAADGVTANILIPGRIDTDRVGQLDAQRAKAEGVAPEDVARRSRATIPAGRYGRVEEFAAAAAFLASSQAGYITGTSLRVDGGLIGAI